MMSARSKGEFLSRVLLGREMPLLGLTLLIAVILSFVLPGFASAENWVTLIRSISVLGMLSVGATAVIIAGGIDLSVVATMVATTGWLLRRVQDGASPEQSLLLALGLALAIGLVNGFLVAYCEIAALLTTLATSLLVIGLATLFLVRLSVVYVPPELEAFRVIGQGQVLGIPIPILILIGLAIAMHLLLSRTKVGLFTYAQGDNASAARLIGVPSRRLIVVLFVLSALTALVAGLVVAGTAGGINLQITNGTMVFDVVLIAVLGGVSLSGGEGRISGVLAAALLIGVMLNGMTLLNVNTIVQDIFKSLVLLVALTADRFLHPIDPETARQGDL
jgi:ribose transport system permease protein